MPSSVCSFARFVSLLPSRALSLSLYLALVHIYIHSGKLGATVAVCAHHQLSCNQPASQPTSQPSSQPEHQRQRHRSFVVMRNRSGNGERRIACCHGTAKLTVIIDPHRRDPRRSCRTPFFFLPLHHRSVIARRS